MPTRCKPGDLAIVVSAKHRCNLGRIVHVIELHDGKGDLYFTRDRGPVWLVRCPTPLTWSIDPIGKRVRRKVGPVPDSLLQPIRGDDAATGTAASRSRTLSKSLKVGVL